MRSVLHGQLSLTRACLHSMLVCAELAVLVSARVQHRSGLMHGVLAMCELGIIPHKPRRILRKDNAGPCTTCSDNANHQSALLSLQTTPAARAPPALPGRAR